MVTSSSLTRFVESLARWDFLQALPLTVSPLYLALTGLCWGLVGLFLTWGLWRGKPVAAASLRWVAPVFVAYDWLDRVALVGGAVARVNWPFRAAFTLTGLAVLYWVLSRPGVRFFFGDRNDG
jgi:hypothetical protein